MPPEGGQWLTDSSKPTSSKPTPVRTASSVVSVKQSHRGLFLRFRLGARRNNYAKDACAYERTNTHLPSKLGSLAILGLNWQN